MNCKRDRDNAGAPLHGRPTDTSPGGVLPHSSFRDRFDQFSFARDWKSLRLQADGHVRMKTKFDRNGIKWWGLPVLAFLEHFCSSEGLRERGLRERGDAGDLWYFARFLSVLLKCVNLCVALWCSTYCVINDLYDV